MNGKVERFNGILATEWAYRQPFISNQDRADVLAPWTAHYNTGRIRSSQGSRPQPERHNLMAQHS
ncbi:hypothetical protein GCM10017714_18820 [Curtobacterium pusillum]|nr:hypothetical protein GCM10017610_33530 [Curtobacterium pusillum]